MKARELIDSAVLDPTMLAVVRAAFDCAWVAVRDRHTSEPDVARARLLLARMALALAARHPADVEALARAIIAQAESIVDRGGPV